MLACVLQRRGRESAAEAEPPVILCFRCHFIVFKLKFMYIISFELDNWGEQVSIYQEETEALAWVECLLLVEQLEWAWDLGELRRLAPGQWAQSPSAESRWDSDS